MSNTSPDQIALFELAPGKPAQRRRAPRMPPAQVVRHCNELIAELDRVAQAHYARSHYGQADHLAQLFEAAERAQHREKREPAKLAEPVNG